MHKAREIRDITQIVRRAFEVGEFENGMTEFNGLGNYYQVVSSKLSVFLILFRYWVLLVIVMALVGGGPMSQDASSRTGTNLSKW